MEMTTETIITGNASHGKKLVTLNLVLLLQLMKISTTPFLMIPSLDFSLQFGRRKERNDVSRKFFRKSITSDVVVLKGVLLQTVTFLVV